MIELPISTIEKPLTPIDYCALLMQCASIAEVREYAERCPLEVRQDERFTRAVQRRLGEIAHAKRKRA